MNLPRLMIVDDDETVLNVVRDIARGCGYDVLALGSPTSVVSAMQQFGPALILLDLSMPEGDGVKLMRRLAQAQCAAKVSVVSAADPKTLTAACRLGREYGLEMTPAFAKPFDANALRAFLSEVRASLRPISSDELLEALSQEQLEVRYQPKVDLRQPGARIVGAEALLRWHHPYRGLLSANRFISLAEQDGLIEPLSSWVLAEVIRQLQVWERKGLGLAVAVNLPSSLLGDIDFPDRVEAMLRHAGVAPRRLMLEITERSAMQDGPTAVDVLTRFRLKDIGLAIDDFGVGHSSLVELYRMPFSELKIDASFVRDMLSNQEARTIVRTLITLAHELGLQACAEGVESAAVVQMLKSFRCDSAQGFLFGSAITGTEFETLYASWPGAPSQGEETAPANLAAEPALLFAAT